MTPEDRPVARPDNARGVHELAGAQGQRLAAHHPRVHDPAANAQRRHHVDQPIAERRDELRCGVAAVDLRSGRLVGLLEFQTAVEEIFDVQLAPGIRFPEVVGFQKETLHHTFVIPPS